MKKGLYKFLVNRNIERWLGERKATAIYIEKKRNIHHSKSGLSGKEIFTKEGCIDFLKGYDIVSFDIFDTLIFRPFSEPTELFHFVGEKFGVADFKEIRSHAEKRTRNKCRREKGHYEVTLQEIWDAMRSEISILPEVGVQVEMDAELQFCYANPFMQEIYKKLQRLGKKIILTSDMYLPKEFIGRILDKNGYTGYDKLYVSCEYGKSKIDGSLFALVRSEQPGRIVHVGDNIRSDIMMAKKNGFDAFYYPNISRNSRK